MAYKDVTAGFKNSLEVRGAELSLALEGGGRYHFEKNHHIKKNHFQYQNQTLQILRHYLIP